jgi:hypothetical protein
MDESDGYAQAWLAELGAHVPEHTIDGAAPPALTRFGLDRTERERAALAGQRLAGEQRRARAYRARTGPPERRA